MNTNSLDVYEGEPELTSGLTELKNLVLLPHIGSTMLETRNKMAEMSAENAIAILKGQATCYRQPRSIKLKK